MLPLTFMNGEFVRLKQEPGIFSKKIHHHITTRGNDITGLAKANLSKQAIDIHVMVRQINAPPLYLRHIISDCFYPDDLPI